MKAYAALQSQSIRSLTIVKIRLCHSEAQAQQVPNVVAVGEIDADPHWRGALPLGGAVFTPSDASFEQIMLEVMNQ